MDRAPHQLLRLRNPVSSSNQGRTGNPHAERDCCKTQIESTMQTAVIASRGDAYIVWNDVGSKLKNWHHHQGKYGSNESASPDEWRTHQSQLWTHCLVECSGQGHSVDQWESVPLCGSEISRWTKVLDELVTPLYNFARKAIIQQLPTAANLVRWGRSQDPLCSLCQNFSQTNKHVLSNCGSALDRYKKRHDEILKILADWITHHIKPDREIYVDLELGQFQQLSNVFRSLRPDIAIISSTRIDTLELELCAMKRTWSHQNSSNLRNMQTSESIQKLLSLIGK